MVSDGAVVVVVVVVGVGVGGDVVSLISVPAHAPATSASPTTIAERLIRASWYRIDCYSKLALCPHSMSAG